jgi:hypothetical protein
MNNDTSTLMTEDATQYLTEAISETFPSVINLKLTAANEINSIIYSFQIK